MARSYPGQGQCIMLLKISCPTYFSPNQPYFLKFYFMKTATIPVYGNIAVYITYCAVCLKMYYTLR